MNRRVTLSLGAILIATLAASAWWIARRDSRPADSRIARTESPVGEDPGAQLQLRREAQRLSRLRESLSEIARSEPELHDAHLQRLRAAIAALEVELASPLPDGRAFAAVNEEYRRQQLHAQGSRQASVLARRREIDERLHGARGGEAEGLGELRTELDEELARIGGVTRPHASNDELAQMRVERAELERRVADLRADLTYWSEQKSGAGVAGRQARAQNLERQIQEQEAIVRTLERRLR